MVKSTINDIYYIHKVVPPLPQSHPQNIFINPKGDLVPIK